MTVVVGGPVRRSELVAWEGAAWVVIGASWVASAWPGVIVDWGGMIYVPAIAFGVALLGWGLLGLAAAASITNASENALVVRRRTLAAGR